MSSALLKTPLFESHVKYGARFAAYAGFNMPLIYKGQSHIESHHWVRNKVGLFDVSHMLQHRISGGNAKKFLQKITPVDLDSLKPNTCSLSVLLNDQGGIVDDTIITKHAEDQYYMVTNAGCRQKDSEFLKNELLAFPDVKHENFESTLLAVQGPGAQELLQKFTTEKLKDVHFGQTRFCSLNGLVKSEIHLSRTGYTGEDGFELSIPSSNAIESQQSRDFFEHLIDEYPNLVKPIGLAARDSLRLEAGMCLYGNELSEDLTPVDATLSWLIPKGRRGEDARFNGSSKILSQLQDKKLVKTRRIGVISEGPAVRSGGKVFSYTGEKLIGNVTSGSPSPTLGKNIAQCYISKDVKVGEEVKIEVRGKLRSGKVVKLPFVETKFYRGL